MFSIWQYSIRAALFKPYPGPFHGRGIWKLIKQILRYSYLFLFMIVCVMAQISWLFTLVPLPPEPSLLTYSCWCAFGVVGQYLVMALVSVLTALPVKITLYGNGSQRERQVSETDKQTQSDRNGKRHRKTDRLECSPNHSILVKLSDP